MNIDIPDDDHPAKTIFKAVESCLEHIRAVNFGEALAHFDINDEKRRLKYYVHIEIKCDTRLPPPFELPPLPKLRSKPVWLSIVDWFLTLSEKIRARWKAPNP